MIITASRTQLMSTETPSTTPRPVLVAALADTCIVGGGHPVVKGLRGGTE